ncbi:hypothetical protein Desor_1337 [Desulfosporosinus orientis DSM 765]|uniref:Uncharacterized protein n=1 Tax=Desulfosporosinus orientis (strain ATCC 19365 / DSM 765 / NCIMB 8382 / VKM B-1628 / Singapore I) TaxID=768706 RepID=G7W5R1_DESOD|nr:hypothetical protein [Desulfosporosinus orientis]AET66999.1 hypothetical protein Desor_1337 [Desulfosporosinus orientis DSM 765]
MNDKDQADLDRFTNNLEKNADSSPMKMVSFTDLFTPLFMSKYTQFANFGELLTFGKFNINSFQEFLALLNEDFDEFIKKTTKFKSWEEMQSTAVSNYFKKNEASK